MLALALFSWWYTAGWMALGRRIEQRLRRTLEFFSVGLLARTLFNPFRQIAAVKGHGPLDAQFRAWADRSFSRMIGAVMRSIFIVTGILTSFLVLIIGTVQFLLWPIVPVLPLIALLGVALGWTL